MLTLTNTEITSIEASQMAYAAITTDGEVISWGDVNYGGNLDTSLGELSNVRELYSGFAGFLALTANDEYLYWGDEIVGVQLSEVSQDIENPQKIIGNYAAFAALNNDGSVVVWGDPTQGGAIYGDTLDAMTSGVIDLASTGVSFAALKSDGSVHAWGSEYFGGLLPEDINENIVQLIGNEGDFTALSAEGSVTSWGFSYGWGGSNTNISVPSSSNFTKVFATSRAFAGIEEDGSVSAWGSVEHGGDASSVSDQLLDIVDISASRYTFVAQNSDGELIAWGASDSAASSIPEIAKNNVVKVVAAQDAFAALKTDGSVVTWGDPENGGDSSSVQELISSGVEDIYSNALSFIALKNDGTLVTWGEPTAGADFDVVSSLVYVPQKFAPVILIAEDTPTGLALEFVGSSSSSKTATADNGTFDYSNLGTFSHVVLESSTYNADIAISDVISSLKHIVGLETLDGAALHAADVDNDDTVAIADVISQLKHIVGLETLNTFDLVDTEGARVTEITEATTELQLVLNGDVDLSTNLISEYAIA